MCAGVGVFVCVCSTVRLCLSAPGLQGAEGGCVQRQTGHRRGGDAGRHSPAAHLHQDRRRDPWPLGPVAVGTRGR